VTRKPVVKLTANFERNLEEIERFLGDADTGRAYGSLLAELLEQVIPNLERFPDIGRPFLSREARSVETTNAIMTLSAKLAGVTSDANALREYVIGDYLLLYVATATTVHLLSIRHHRQLSFDFQGRWEP
jgi:plasmid stabilization system protein ParE